MKMKVLQKNKSKKVLVVKDLARQIIKLAVNANQKKNRNKRK